MKKIFFLIFLFAFIKGSFSQDIIYKDGLYFKVQNLYSGKYFEYYENGNVKMEMNILNGRLENETILYFENGTKKEIRSYKEGKKNGTWITWNEKGIKTAEAFYTMDKKDGKWTIWDDNGQKRYEMFYSDGKKIGTWYINYGEKVLIFF